MSTDISGPSWQQEVATARSRTQSGIGHHYALHRTALAALFVLLTALIVLGVEVSTGLSRDELNILMLALATFGLASLPIVLNQGLPKERRHIFITLIGVLFIGSYALPPLLHYIPNTPPIDAPSFANSHLQYEDVITGQLVGILGLMTLLVSYCLPMMPALARRLPRVRTDWPRSTLLIVSIAMLAVGWTVSLAWASGLIPEAWGSGFIGTLTLGTIYANVTLTLAWIRHRSPLALTLLAMNVALGGLLGVISGSKTQVLIRPFVTAVTYVLVRGTVPTRWIALGLFLVALLYPASEISRSIRAEYPSFATALSDPVGMLSAIGATSREWDFSQWMETGSMGLTARTDALGATSVLVRDTPSRVEFQNGGTLVLFFQAWIPRILWPEKPTTFIGQWITDVYGSGPHITSHTAPSHIGEYYINFGIMGVVLGMFLIGSIIRLAHESLMSRGGTAVSILVMSILVYNLVLKFESSVAGTYAKVAFALIPIWFIHKAVILLLPTITKQEPGDAAPPVAQPPPVSWSPTLR